MKFNKVFGEGTAAAQHVGEARLRGMADVNMPFMTATGPGFKSFKSNGFGNSFDKVHLSQNEESGDDWVIATGTHKSNGDYRILVGDSPELRNPYFPIKQSQYVIGSNFLGQHAFFARARPPSEGVSQVRECETVIRNDTEDPPAAPSNETVSRQSYEPSQPLAMWLFQNYPLSIYYAEELCKLQTSPVPAVPTLFDSYTTMGIKENGDIGAILINGELSDSRVDDYGFKTVHLVANAWFYGVSGSTVNLPVPADTVGEHSYVAGSVCVLKPGVLLLPAVELFTPAKYQKDPESSARASYSGRILMYKSVDWGQTWSVTAPAAWMDGMPDEPAPSPLSSHFDNPEFPVLRVAFKASQYEVAINGAMCGMVFGSSVVTAKGAAVYFGVKVLPDGGGYQLAAVRTVDDGETWAPVSLPTVMATAGVPYVRAEAVRPGIVLARVQLSQFNDNDGEVLFLRSTDNGATWSELTPQGLDALMNQRSIGTFTVTRTSQDKAVVILPVISGDKVIMMMSMDDGSSWRRSSRMFNVDKWQPDWPFVMAPGEAGTQSRDYPSGWETIGDMGVCFYVGKRGRPAPASIATPWRLDESLENAT